eukprot:13370511-Heterocapsa_arctica.AAC.1
MTEEHMKAKVRWFRTLDTKDPVYEGTIKDDTILEKEEMTHSRMEKHVHMQCQEAMTEGCGLAPEDMNDNFNIVQNSRYGWVPHTLIFKWLADGWGDMLTHEIFWNMMLHTKNDKE